MGERAAEAALEALRGSPSPSASTVVEARSAQAWVPLRNSRFRLAFALGLFDAALYTRGERDTRTGTFLFQGRPVTVPLGEDLRTEVSYVRLGDLEVLGVPGEI